MKIIFAWKGSNENIKVIFSNFINDLFFIVNIVKYQIATI